MGTDAPREITVRRVNFEYGDGPGSIDPLVIAGQPEQSFSNVALSLLLPYLEPYLIRSMRHARPLVTNARVLADLDLFNGQEGQHYRQHIAFNEAVRIPAGAKVKELEAELDGDYRRYSKERSLRWNLAYAEGFEALTCSMARFSFEVGLLDRMQPQVRELFAWHLVEEMEHRTVAFDVYEHVSGGYFYRLFVGLFAQWHLLRFVTRTARTMATGDPVEFRRLHGGLFRALQRQVPLVLRMTVGLLPKVLSTYLPWYTPHRIEMPASARALADHYSEIVRTAAAAPAISDS